MCRRFAFLFLIGGFLIGLPGVSAQSGPGLFGPGVDRLVVEDDPDENGLVLQLQEPNTSRELWAVVVSNQSDEAMTRLVLRIEVMIDGEWYIPNMEAARVGVRPIALAPGEIGFAVADELGNSLSDWEEARVFVDEERSSEPTAFLDLELTRLEQVSAREVTGTVVNQTDVYVREVQVYGACVAEDGRITDDWWDNVDIRKLDPGDSIDFEYTRRTGVCEEGSALIASAIGENREG